MNATATKPRCQCGLWNVEVEISGASRMVGTGCNAAVETAQASFLRGHDAKLKSFLIKAGIRKQPVQHVTTGDLVDAVAAGDRYGFGYMVRAGIENNELRKEKAAAKRAAKKASKDQGEHASVEAIEAAIEEGEQEPQIKYVKIGRWTYDVVAEERIDEDTILVTYRTRQGEEKTTEVAPYAILTA